EGLAVALVHHLRKGDGAEATASRGSGALTAFADTIIELRRFDAGKAEDRRRTLRGWGRSDETPAELVVELAEGGGYVAVGDRAEVRQRDLSDEVQARLPRECPGWDVKTLLERWGDEDRPGRGTLSTALNAGAEGPSPRWRREGEGKRTNPF